MSRRLRPFRAWAVPQVKIIAAEIGPNRWRYTVAPAGRPRVTAHSLRNARAVARFYSRRVLEHGPAQAFGASSCARLKRYHGGEHL
jgi:hypothetical protein